MRSPRCTTTPSGRRSSTARSPLATLRARSGRPVPDVRAQVWLGRARRRLSRGFEESGGRLLRLVLFSRSPSAQAISRKALRSPDVSTGRRSGSDVTAAHRNHVLRMLDERERRASGDERGGRFLARCGRRLFWPAGVRACDRIMKHPEAAIAEEVPLAIDWGSAAKSTGRARAELAKGQYTERRRTRCRGVRRLRRLRRYRRCPTWMRPSASRDRRSPRRLHRPPWQGRGETEVKSPSASILPHEACGQAAKRFGLDAAAGVGLAGARAACFARAMQ